MNPMFPVVELMDRLAIAEIKFGRTNGANESELKWYQDQAKSYDLSKISEEYQQLKDIHNNIWNLESDLKSGMEDKHPLDEIGRRAIAIRNMNNKRVALRNVMAEKLNDAIRELKFDHASE
jgi:hypothetical protein